MSEETSNRKYNKTHNCRHIAVRKEGQCLQCVEFGGKIFVEVMLTFGGWELIIQVQHAIEFLDNISRGVLFK
jgi:hypothetical protein